MSLAQFALKRPYTIIASLMLICIMGIGAGLRMPIDIFPEIDIPVVSVVWTYSGMSPQDIQNRILTLHERQLASLVDDIARIEATSYTGVGVEKVYLHEGADVTRAISQLASSALVVLKYMPRNITPPLVLRYGATDVPIIQLSLSSSSLPDTKLNDLGQNIIRPDLAVVHGAEVPYPYGGKPRVIMVDLDPHALAGARPHAVRCSDALQRQNVILPSGDVKIGTKDYALAMNNSPDAIAAINEFPSKRLTDARCSSRRRPRPRRSPNSDQFRLRRWPARRADDDPEDRRRLDAGRHQRRPGSFARYSQAVAAGRVIKAIFDQSIFVKASMNSVSDGRGDGGGTHRDDDPAVPRQLAADADHPGDDSLSIVTAILIMYVVGQTLQHDDAGRLRAGGGHSRRQRHGGDRKHRATVCRATG